MDTIAPAVVERLRKRVGTIVREKYRLDAILGIGGMAAVFAATHRNAGRVALKVLHSELAANPDVRGRFLREGYIANKIPHAGVVRVLDDDVDDELDTVFLVMDLLIGETVADRAARDGDRLPIRETCELADETLDVLAAAHEQGIIHRDVKPENLFITSAGELKMLDFGIAQLRDGTSSTRTGDLLGTPAYMAPEQAAGLIREIDARTDLWSVGAMVFSLISGRPVHAASTGSQQLIYAATQPAPPLASVARWVTPKLAAVVDRALAFERSERWSSAREMQAALRAAASAGSKPMRPAGARTLIQGSGGFGDGDA
jgi:serine/threonine-protein kinase